MCGFSSFTPSFISFFSSSFFGGWGGGGRVVGSFTHPNSHLLIGYSFTHPNSHLLNIKSSNRPFG